MNKILLSIAFAFIIGIVVPTYTIVAAPLPDGTKLLIEQGVGSGFNVPCATGSCFSMEVAPAQLTWTDFGPGTDGGFILGKDQVSGGQELGPSGTNTTPGELSTAWYYFSNYGTFTTTSYPALNFPAGASDNLFDYTSCTGADCIGKTELNAWYVAWNGGIYPFGSATTDCACYSGIDPDGLCKGVTEWALTPSPAMTGSNFVLNYVWMISEDCWSSVQLGVILRGEVIIPECACDDNDACTSDYCDEPTVTCMYDTISCDDNNVCTDDAPCDPVNGCVYANNTLACDDNNDCTTDDVCSDGVCSGLDTCNRPVLTYPVDGQPGLGSTVEFRWKKIEGAVSYDFHNCADDPTASCSPETVTAELNSNRMLYAGGAGLFLIGMTFIGGLKGRKMMVLIFVFTVVFAGGSFISCSNSKTSDESITPLPADEMSHMVQGLSPSTTYYWKVVADDGNGNTATSEVRSFTTQ